MITPLNIITWYLCTTTRAQVVTDTVDWVLAVSCYNQAIVNHSLGLLSDNGTIYLPQDLVVHCNTLAVMELRPVEHVGSTFADNLVIGPAFGCDNGDCVT